MPLDTRTVVIDNLYSVQLANRTSQIFDNIFGAHAFWWALRESRNGGLDPETGGTQIERTLSYAKNTTVEGIGLGGEVSLNVPEHLTTCKWEWKYIAGSIIRYFVQEQKNRGPGAMMKVVNANIDNLQDSMEEYMEENLFGDGTGDSGKTINGLGNIVAVANTTGTVGGHDRASKIWWRNYAAVSAGDAQVNLRPELTTMYNTLSRGKQHPDLNCTTQTIHEWYEDEHVGMRRLTENAKMADAGFRNFEFKGTPVVWSDSCPSGRWYMLTLKFLQFVYDRQVNFKMTNWKDKANTLDRYAQKVLAGNLISTNCRHEGVLSSITSE